MERVSPLVAVVDDETPVRNMLRRALRFAEYEVAAYSSGDELLAALPTCAPTCIVLDIRMPGLSGLDVLQHIRSRGDQVPVILITASDDPELERTAAVAGAFCLLRKPFSTDALMDAVRSAHGDLAGVAPQQTG